MNCKKSSISYTVSWKKTYKTIHQLSCFEGHPVCILLLVYLSERGFYCSCKEHPMINAIFSMSLLCANSKISINLFMWKPTIHGNLKCARFQAKIY